MGEIIYWKKYDKPKPYSHTHSYKDKEGNEKSFTDSGEVTGEWVCSDERVERAWVTGGFHPTSMDNKEIQYSLDIIFKNGDRKAFRTGKLNIETDDHNLEPLISQAEQYLQSLK